MRNSAFLREVSDQHGISSRRLAAALKTTKSGLAIVVGLSPDALANAAPIGRVATQSRLNEMCGIIDRLILWAGSAPAAYNWYRSRTLPSFGDATADELVRQGWSSKVHAYLDRLKDGGFA
ncbi:XRE family transcriptional regulator [Novosphingobium sp. ERW19]|uniref:XRE family transcriptional regulator n=1 Tax=Novosphingobium sp. ERW19 TaxID=2726186 RepID=UPI00145693FE|nr:XRE family transcriptional regulator [Novosphingobium sp. ERW19]NLR40585.1 XRE family transcriptional regulator [Novosphingobium sp. ERW19]